MAKGGGDREAMKRAINPTGGKFSGPGLFPVHDHSQVSKKLAIIARFHRDGVLRMEGFGLRPQDVVIVTRLEEIRGLQGMLFVYAGEASQMDDFYDIVDYMMGHDMVCLKSNSGHDFMSPGPTHA